MTIEQAIDDLMDASRTIAEVAESESDEANRINAQNCADDCKQIAELLRELVELRKAPEIVHCGECKHYKIDHPKANGYHCCYRCHNIFPMKEDDFCSRAERRTDK